MYPKPDENISICLDSVTARLSKILGRIFCNFSFSNTVIHFKEIEKRRIYDILNILESVEIVSRIRKNQYQWHGFNQLKKTISKLNVNLVRKLIVKISCFFFKGVIIKK
jgi:hypothetical protein